MSRTFLSNDTDQKPMSMKIQMKRQLFTFCHCIHVFAILIFTVSPLIKGHGPSYEQICIPSTQRCFKPSLAEFC